MKWCWRYLPGDVNAYRYTGKSFTGIPVYQNGLPGICPPKVRTDPIRARRFRAAGCGVRLHRSDEVADRLAPPMGDEPLRELLGRPLVDDELDEAARLFRGEGPDDPVRHGVERDRVLIERLLAAPIPPAPQVAMPLELQRQGRGRGPEE